MDKPIDISNTYILTTHDDQILGVIKGENSINDIKFLIKKKGNYYDVEIVLIKPIDKKDYNILTNIRSQDDVFVANYFLLYLPQ